MKELQIQIEFTFDEQHVQGYLDERKKFTLVIPTCYDGFEKKVFTFFPGEDFIFVEDEKGYTDRINKKSIKAIKKHIETLISENLNNKVFTNKNPKQGKVKVKLNYQKEALEKAFKKGKDFCISLPHLQADLEMSIYIYFDKNKIYLQNDDQTKKIKTVDDLIKYMKKFNG